jgi:pyridoxal phosphate enzyme (YggS family)
MGYDIQKPSMVDVAANCREVLHRIGEAAAKCGRDPRSVQLLAASKAQSASRIQEAIAAGIRLFGENYVQEAKGKRAAIQAAVEWHMIGHLQRNKVRAALELFDLIQSLDNVELARELDKEGKKRNRLVRVLIEVNLGGEESKSGVAKEKVAALLAEAAALSHLRVEGLMAIPPFREDPEEMRPYFRALRKLREELMGLKIPGVDLRELSMGMTHDYAVAIQEGATLVRIGTALFGPRE